MASGEMVDEVIRRIINILDAASVPYMLTGSFASSLHGMPRATQDIDLVIAPNPESLEALLKNFPEDQYYEIVGPDRLTDSLNTLGSEVPSQMEFLSGLCDNQPSSMAQSPLTSPIPPIGADGYLPEGVHVCSEADVIFRFGSANRRRRRLALRLRRWIELGRQVGAKRLLVDGSFVSAKEEPHDVDTVILLPEDFSRQLE